VPKKKRLTVPQPYHHGDLRRALIDTALEMVTEEQNWTFSLRELARRAGVSHQAPYNHFPEKQDLLGAVAVVGFERLRDGMLRAMAGIDAPEALVDMIGRTYVRLGLENPALYRLMFGPALADAGPGNRPTIARSAGARARAVLEEAIERGARSGAFSVSANSREDQVLAAHAFWSAVHGLTMLVIDDLLAPNVSVDGVIEMLLRTQIKGLRQARTRR
jgi:AcrR family transcriptional regulator